MRKTYLLPELNVLKTTDADILTVSYIYDEENRDNVVVDPFIPSTDDVLNRPNA